MSGENTAVKLPRGKFPGLLSSSSGIREFLLKRKITRNVENRIERFTRSGRRSGNLPSRNSLLEDFDLCKFDRIDNCWSKIV